MAGTEGRVYGGDCKLVHVADKERTQMGEYVAVEMEDLIRDAAYKNGSRTWNQSRTQRLCPGCYMVVGFNALVTLANDNRQSLRELGLSMAKAFTKLAECPPDQMEQCIEEIQVVLDS